MVLGNLACTTHGATMVIPNYTFDAQLTLEAVAAERCTSLYGVPTMFIAELALPNFKDFDLSTLRTGIMAGSPCPVEVMKRVQSEMHMPEVTICYGMTETSPVSTQTMTDDPLEKRTGTVGRVHPHIEVKIVDAEGGSSPRGTPGELCTRGYSVMLGYWDDPEATAGAIDAARYMHTGDIATMDEDGYVNIAGRIKDMVIRGGENVYPREIEEFLYTHPAIKDVQVIGVPDERYGEELCAWVIVNDGATASADDVSEYCHGKIAHYKIPRYVKFVEGWPMTVSGKVQKYKMREESIAKLGLESAAKIVTAGPEKKKAATKTAGGSVRGVGTAALRADRARCRRDGDVHADRAAVVVADDDRTDARRHRGDGERRARTGARCRRERRDAAARRAAVGRGERARVAVLGDGELRGRTRNRQRDRDRAAADRRRHGSRGRGGVRASGWRRVPASAWGG